MIFTSFNTMVRLRSMHLGMKDRTFWVKADLHEARRARHFIKPTLWTLDDIRHICDDNQTIIVE